MGELSILYVHTLLLFAVSLTSCTAAAAAAGLTSAAADASFLHLSPDLSIFSATIMSNTIAISTFDAGGLFFPILSSPSFINSSLVPSGSFGFSLGFYHIPRGLFETYTPDSCAENGCNMYMAVCAGSSFGRNLSASVNLVGGIKNVSLKDLYRNRTVDGFAAPVWIANLDSPIRYADQASLRVVAKGGSSELQLRDGEKVVWNVPNVAIMEMQDSGHLLIYNSSNRSQLVWQSSPNTGFLLPYAGQTLAVGNELVSNDSSYVARMEKGGLAFYMNKTLFNRELQPPPYWLFPLPRDRDGPKSLNQLISSPPCSNSPANAEFESFREIFLSPGSCNSNYTVLMFPSTDEIEPWMSLWRLESDGMLYYYAIFNSSNGSVVSVTRTSVYDIYSNNNNDNEVRPLFLEWQECNVPMACGPLGVCTAGAKPSCSCPFELGLEPVNNSNIFQGCKRHNDLPNCTFGNGHNTGSTDFLQLDSIASILLFNEWTFNSTPGVGVNACKESCLFDCSCKGFFYQKNSSSCFFIIDELTLLTVVDKNYSSIIDFVLSSTQYFNGYEIFARDYVTFLKTSSERGGKGGNSHTIAWIALSAIIPSVMVCGMAGYLFRARRKKNLHSSMLWREESKELQEILPLLPCRYSYKELFEASVGFTKLLGAGGCGSVYAGVLPDGRKVAIKVLQVVLQGTGHSKQFLAEIATIGRTHHHNIVRLVGFCWEVSQRLLVYEYVERGSLDRWIFVRAPAFDADTCAAVEAPFLDWKTRYNVALGIARGLNYLHEDCEQPILHFDIKPQNILLDDEFVVKLADFGMSRLIERDMSAVVTGMRGTPGYIAPEWCSQGTVSKKSDVFSMGMVLLEIVGGRKNLDFSLLNNSSDPVEQEAWHFPSWASRKCKQGLMMEVVDKRLHECGFDMAQAVKLINIAFWCIQEDPARRPNASTVEQWLEGSSVVEQPPFFNVALNVGSRPKKLLMPVSFNSPR